MVVRRLPRRAAASLTRSACKPPKSWPTFGVADICDCRGRLGHFGVHRRHRRRLHRSPGTGLRNLPSGEDGGMGPAPVLRAGAGRQRRQRHQSPGLTPANFDGHVLHACGSGYAANMLAKLNLIKPLVVGGAVAAAIAVTPVAAAEAFAAGPTSTGSVATHVVFKQDPGGQGCDPNGNCGSGGQNGGPGGGPGGQGCVPGVGCGSGGQFAGPGGIPGGTGCLPGVGCGSGHG